MTINTEISRSGPYAGAGTTGPFLVNFRILDAAHLRVVKLSAGIESTLAYPADYLVTGVGNPTSSLATTVAVLAGETLTIIRDVPKTQEADYVQNDDFPAQSHEDALDKLTMIVQQVGEAQDRALTLPVSASTASTELPAPQSNKLIGWNAAANGLQNVDPATLATIVAFGTAKADVFTGTGAQTVFTLTANPGAQANLDVAIGGVTQLPGTDYTWSSGTTLTFTTAPPNGVKVLARYMIGLPQGTSDSASSAFIQSGAGAVQRTVQDKLRDTVSVADYGMKPSASSAVNKAALTAALVSNDSVFIPAGTYQIDPGGVDITGKRIRGEGIYRTILQLPGTNTQGVILTNNKTSAASWGTGGTLDLRELSLRGNWDGSTALVDQSWDNTAALLKIGAMAGVRLVDVEFVGSYGHGMSAYRLGYATLNRVKVRTNKKNGMHLEAPGGGDAITSTWITDCDLNSNRGAGNIYLKNGAGVFITKSVFEDAAAGVVLDGTDNRVVTITNNHCETNTQGLLSFIGSGLKTSVCHNYCDAPITRSNPAFQTVYAVGNVGTPNVIEDGIDRILQVFESGDGTAANLANNVFSLFGTANFGDVIGRLRWRSNNNNNVSVSAAEIRAVARGNVNQNFGALEFGTGNNGLVFRYRMDEVGNFYPIADATNVLGVPGTTGVAGTMRWLNVYSQNIVLSPPAAVTPANNGEVTFQLTSNTSLTFKVKGSDGVVRSGSIVLS